MKAAGAVFLVVLAFFSGLNAQTQQDSMPAMHNMGRSQQQSPNDNPLPQMGTPATDNRPVYHLAELEAMALQQNPTLLQADALQRMAEGRKQQAGLWPNPTLGYFGDEISGGFGVNGGRQGGFIEQTILLGRKLYLAQRVASDDQRIAGLQKEEQRYRVQNAVRAAYFQTLAAQEMLSLMTARAELASRTLDNTRLLQNTGARDASEVAMAEIELERARLNVEVQHTQLEEQWEILRSILATPSLPEGHLAGKLDADLPQIEPQQLVNALLAESPAVKIARQRMERAQNSLVQEQRRAVPDLQLRAGLEQNFETNDLTGRPYGVQGVAEARIGLPLFNRNQGGVTAARAELESSQAESRAIELQLRHEAAAVVQQYESARLTVEGYRDKILPRTRALYEMQRNAWGRMALSYPQLLLAEQNLFTSQAEYIHALQNLRTSAVALSGFLLTEQLATTSLDCCRK